MWCYSAVLFFCVNLIYGLSFYGFGNEFEYVVKNSNETTINLDSAAINISWIEQPLDHFDSANNGKWNMRYLERHDLWEAESPIYLYLGGNGPARTVFLETGMMYDLAKETNGALFVAEHRYYGESKPFDDFTTENFKYLSSRQALADFANLLQTLKSLPKYETSKVVVVGGSYSGNLAAWMKLLYPDLVDAAIASSAPVLATIDFKEYLEIVGDNYRFYGSRECRDQIEMMFTQFELYFTSKEGIEVLKEDYNICDDCDMSKTENQELFFMDQAAEFSQRVQYGTPEVVQEYCDSGFTSDFRERKEYNIFWHEDSQCYSYDFNDMIMSIKNDDREIAWTYQTCTEFANFQTSSSINQPFTDNIPLELYFNICEQLFAIDEDRVNEGVEETNKLYGGLSPNVSNVVFVHGDMDPWSVLGILEDISSEVMASAVTISDTSHGRDLFSDEDSDSEELKEARSDIRNLIKFWIEEKDEKEEKKDGEKDEEKEEGEKVEEKEEGEKGEEKETTTEQMRPIRRMMTHMMNKAREMRQQRRERKEQRRKDRNARKN